MGYPHHVQSAATMPIEPKFPPSEDYAHNGYGVAAMSNASDYMQHHHHMQSSVANGHQANGGYSPYGHQAISGHFYHHHHHGYSAQMPHASANTGYANGGGGGGGGGVGAGSGGGGGGGGGSGAGGYYGGYYGATAGHQIMDLPVQYPAMEPTNTALGLHELGASFNNIFIIYFLFMISCLNITYFYVYPFFYSNQTLRYSNVLRRKSVHNGTKSKFVSVYLVMLRLTETYVVK